MNKNQQLIFHFQFLNSSLRYQHFEVLFNLKLFQPKVLGITLITKMSWMKMCYRLRADTLCVLLQTISLNDVLHVLDDFILLTRNRI